jgi:hypothetical protein
MKRFLDLEAERSGSSESDSENIDYASSMEGFIDSEEVAV